MSGKLAMVLIAILAGCVCIIAKMLYTMTVKRGELMNMAEKYEKLNDTIPANRGNILSADGQLMSISLPEYNIFMDFEAGGKEKDSLLTLYLDTISEGLHRIIPEWTAEQFKQRIDSGRKVIRTNKDGEKTHLRYYSIYPRAVSYVQFNEIKKLPLFNTKRRFFSGLVGEPRNNRVKPFGSLASRMIGEVYAKKDSARFGIELAYDSVLRGKPGIRHIKRELNKYVNFVDQEPEDGCDVVTTIDLEMQDICESALREKMHEINASMGVVVLMEVQTGDVKAIVNLQRYDDGKLYEARNYALASLMEPGSTFKTASILVALDDGMITVNDKVETGGGRFNMHNAVMKDHNWHSGGYGTIDVPHVLMYSSNIGVSRLIDDHYKNNPEKFVEGLHRVGIAEPLGLEFNGMADPRLSQPGSKHWSKTTLPWMSIGYECQIPPISTVTFYNAIANNGRMMRPRFVKSIQKDGEVIREIPVEVIKEHICGDQALSDIRTILRRVVSEGLGKRAGNPHFSVSGKTGTAQVSQGKAGYTAGMREYLVSFCGFYPSEAPKYTCIVAIRKPGLPASGGTMAGTVFAKIASRVYSKDIDVDMRQVNDSAAVRLANVKNGNVKAAKNVMETIQARSNGLTADNEWSLVSADDSQYACQPINLQKGVMPDLKGMGARDAIFLVEKAGGKARVSGYGSVAEQSVKAGSALKNGQIVYLQMK